MPASGFSNCRRVDAVTGDPIGELRFRRYVPARAWECWLGHYRPRSSACRAEGRSGERWAA